jgi:hypothetical protein
MKTSHCVQICDKGFALSGLKLLDEVVHGLLDEQLYRVSALCIALLIR